ncbi:hypothetical protein HKX48_002806 [Thoreauomyces humboldtii]|nr:hypothetical protein HKX48_002806 [Thoreauomyces humboldtii]
MRPLNFTFPSKLALALAVGVLVAFALSCASTGDSSWIVLYGFTDPTGQKYQIDVGLFNMCQISSSAGILDCMSGGLEGSARSYQQAAAAFQVLGLVAGLGALAASIHIVYQKLRDGKAPSPVTYTILVSTLCTTIVFQMVATIFAIALAHQLKQYTSSDSGNRTTDGNYAGGFVQTIIAWVINIPLLALAILRKDAIMR